MTDRVLGSVAYKLLALRDLRLELCALAGFVLCALCALMSFMLCAIRALRQASLEHIGYLRVSPIFFGWQKVDALVCLKSRP